ncbi:MAG: hypothetical protein JKY37_23970 [Nannocystaceae bacterium]|nr:hypothetical protein [Nannocystaceae bacterium]
MKFGSTGPAAIWLAGALPARGPTISPPTDTVVEGSTGEVTDPGPGLSTSPSTTDSGDAQTSTGVDRDPGTSTGSAPSVEMYGECGGRAALTCLPGLLCAVVSLADGARSICSRQCGDPANDCDPPPVGWSPVCAAFLHDPPDPFCAIGCNDDGGCPAGTSCGDEPPFSLPYYCVPD